MLKYRAVAILMSILALSVVESANTNSSRRKRQSPNINVHEIPKTSFTCDDKKVGEYYADEEANCQVYHVCIPGMHNRLSLISFACPNGTIFSQATRVCTPYERVDCRLTLKFYENVHGSANSRRTNYESDNEYENNYVPPPQSRPQPQPQPQPQPPRQSAPSRSRNTPAPPPPPPQTSTQPPRNNRFRSGSNQFRGQQAPPAVTTPAPVRTTLAPQPAVAVRGSLIPARPALPGFRPPVLAARPPQSGVVLVNALPPRPTVRSVVSTSTNGYNYEYEYEYEYEDETPVVDPANVRGKRDVKPQTHESVSKYDEKATSFTCDDKVPGAAYADVESNCEMFHICILLGKYKVLDYKVYCVNETVFDQETGSCREKEEVVCENSHLFYQFEKVNQPTSNKKPVIVKKNSFKSKKPTRLSKE